LGISDLLQDEGSDGGYGGYYRWNVQHRDVLGWLLGIARIVQPRIRCIRVGMVVKVKDFDYAIPYRFPFIDFLYRHTFTVRSFRTVEFVNNIP